MCILIKQPAGHSFSIEEFVDFNDYNQDGFGAMLKTGKEIFYKKSTSINVNEYYNIYKKYFEFKECYLHFRQATSGLINKSNCHPFLYNKKLLLMHNGILNNQTIHDKSKNDTLNFIDEYLVEIGDYIFNQKIAKLIGEAIGQNNKFVIISKDKEIIINKESGYTDKLSGVWYSNLYAWTSPIKNKIQDFAILEYEKSLEDEYYQDFKYNKCQNLYQY